MLNRALTHGEERSAVPVVEPVIIVSIVDVSGERGVIASSDGDARAEGVCMSRFIFVGTLVALAAGLASAQDIPNRITITARGSDREVEGVFAGTPSQAGVQRLTAVTRLLVRNTAAYSTSDPKISGTKVRFKVGTALVGSPTGEPGVLAITELGLPEAPLTEICRKGDLEFIVTLTGTKLDRETTFLLTEVLADLLGQQNISAEIVEIDQRPKERRVKVLK